MVTAWAASIVAQSLYAASLWRTAGPSWWAIYLACESLRMAALLLAVLSIIPLRTHDYWYAWALTQVAVSVPAICALTYETRGSQSRFLGIALGVGAVLWSLTLTDPHWPVMRRAGLLMHQSVAYGGLGVLVASWSDGRIKPAMLLYFLIESLEVLAEQIARTPILVEQLGTVYLLTLAALFSALILNRKALNYGGTNSQ